MQTRAGKLLSKYEAADRLGIKWRKLDYMRERGQIAFVKIGKLVKFLEADLEKYIRDHRIVAVQRGRQR